VSRKVKWLKPKTWILARRKKKRNLNKFRSSDLKNMQKPRDETTVVIVQ
jgi:hypothetical protein